MSIMSLKDPISAQQLAIAKGDCARLLVGQTRGRL